jgi:hypothetical protein
VSGILKSGAWSPTLSTASAADGASASTINNTTRKALAFMVPSLLIAYFAVNESPRQ